MRNGLGAHRGPGGCTNPGFPEGEVLPGGPGFPEGDPAFFQKPRIHPGPITRKPPNCILAPLISPSVLSQLQEPSRARAAQSLVPATALGWYDRGDRPQPHPVGSGDPETAPSTPLTSPAHFSLELRSLVKVNPRPFFEPTGFMGPRTLPAALTSSLPVLDAELPPTPAACRRLGSSGPWGVRGACPCSVGPAAPMLSACQAVGSSVFLSQV